MGAITAGVVTAAAAAYGAYQSNEARQDAKRAANQQAQGVVNAQTATVEGVNRARDALMGLNPITQEQFELQNRLDRLIEHNNALGASTGQSGMFDSFSDFAPPPQGSPASGGQPLDSFQAPQSGATQASGIAFPQDQSVAQIADSGLGAMQKAQPLTPGQPQTPDMAGNVLLPPRELPRQTRLNTISDLQGQIAELNAARQSGVDPRGELLDAIQGQTEFTREGFAESQGVLEPLANLANPLIEERQALLGFGGEDARQAALSRVSDPLRAEQERAMMRNNASLGGVGGNVLSSLAEQTRARTEANIGNRLNQLSQATAPSLNALQQISDLRLNRGLSLADITGAGGRDLSAQETARRQALANIELGQGSELAQLAQNLGTARAGGAAFAAQSQSPLSAGLSSGLNMFNALNNAGMFNQQQQAPQAQPQVAMNVQNPNLYGGVA